METLEVTFTQAELDMLTDLIDRAVKNPVSGGLQAIDNASRIMGKLRASVIHKQMADASQEVVQDAANEAQPS